MPCCLNAPTDWMTCLQSDVYSVQCIVCPALSICNKCLELLFLYNTWLNTFVTVWVDRPSSVPQRNTYTFMVSEYDSDTHFCAEVWFLIPGSGCFLWWNLSQGGLTGGQTSLSPHRLVTFERYENDFACITPRLSYSYSIKSMNKPSVCFPADKVIAIDLWATWVTIMKSVCRHTMNVEQSVCLFARKKANRWLYQWNGTVGDKTIIAESKG